MEKIEQEKLFKQVGLPSTWSEGYYLGVILTQQNFNMSKLILENHRNVFRRANFADSSYDGFIDGVLAVATPEQILEVESHRQNIKLEAMKRFAKAILR